MFAKRYIKIGAAAANDIQFTDPELLPYHALLLQDSNGAVYFHLCVAEARAILNGTPVEQLAELHADDHLQIGTTNLAIKDLFDWPVQVYWEDTDAGGVVYHSQYLNFMERARTEWLRHLGFIQTEMRETLGVLFVVRHIDMHYKKPAKFDDALEF